jgi:hypothetical protein
MTVVLHCSVGRSRITDGTFPGSISGRLFRALNFVQQGTTSGTNAVATDNSGKQHSGASSSKERITTAGTTLGSGGSTVSNRERTFSGAEI